MRDDGAMAEQWIIRVEGREYGPADVATLREWKAEGRVLAANEARPVDVDLWSTAAQIPGLFGLTAPPVQVESAPSLFGDLEEPAKTPRVYRPHTRILAETFRIYRRGFFKFFGLTLLVIGPSICAQLTGAVIASAPNVDVDLRTLVSGGFGFCMMLLTIVLTPVYIAGIQVLTAELAAGRRIGFLAVLNDAMKFWPRVAFLWIFVCLCYAFWTLLPIGIVGAIALGGPSAVSLFLALLVLTIQVWVTGRLFVNFLFWQQFAVLENCDAAESLRRSKELARSAGDLAWFRRPMWRGVFIASLWFALVLALNWPTIWPFFQTIWTTSDPQALAEALKTSAKSAAANDTSFAISIVQAILKPLLGIAFVLLFFDSKIDTEQ
jgi:hypothetical protein